MPVEVTTTSSETPATREQKDVFSNARVRSLRLKPVTTVRANDASQAAIELMREKGFDQLPVLTADGKKLAGLVTLGNVLSWISRGRATAKSPVSEVMFDFSKLPEVVTNHRDLGASLQAVSITGEEQQKGHGQATSAKNRNKFFEITWDTPLSVLNRFFEWNSAAVITERDESGAIKPVAVATKVDLLTWLLHQNNNKS